MHITSPAFENGKTIPRKFTCDGENVNPALVIEGIPPRTRSLVLVIDDPDSPGGSFVHWVVYNIPVMTRIDEDSVPGLQGMNGFGTAGYGGPCPHTGTHRYVFRVYALDDMVGLPDGKSRREVEDGMEGSILAQAELVGIYGR